MAKAEHGSQFDLLQWVMHSEAALNERLLEGSPTLREFAQRIEWLAPDKKTGKELKDGAWTMIGLRPPSPQAAAWWPMGGPTWDGVARVHGAGGEVGALFVEAKGHPAEMRAGGTGSRDASNAKKIATALIDVQAELGVPFKTHWLGAVYQPANRLGWLWFARHHQSHAEKPLRVWLVSIYFCGGYYPWAGGKLGPADEQAWRADIDALHHEMRLPDPPDPLTHHWIELFLPSTVKLPGEDSASMAGASIRDPHAST